MTNDCLLETLLRLNWEGPQILGLDSIPWLAGCIFSTLQKGPVDIRDNVGVLNVGKYIIYIEHLRLLNATHLEIFATKKKKNLTWLSIESWLVNGDPYHGLL